MKQSITILAFLFIQLSLSQQTENYSYTSRAEIELNNNTNELEVVDSSIKETMSTIHIDETQKIITVSREFIAVNGSSRTSEKYHYVKKEPNQDNSRYKYYAIDLLNKKYIEIVISEEFSYILEDCNFFTTCSKGVIFSNY